MYAEIQLIEKVTCKKARANLILDFIEEYSGWIQHLKTVGITWGAGGEEVGAAKELKKATLHVANLKQYLLTHLTQ